MNHVVLIPYFANSLRRRGAPTSPANMPWGVSEWASGRVDEWTCQSKSVSAASQPEARGMWGRGGGYSRLLVNGRDDCWFGPTIHDHVPGRCRPGCLPRHMIPTWGCISFRLRGTFLFLFLSLSLPTHQPATASTSTPKHSSFRPFAGILGFYERLCGCGLMMTPSELVVLIAGGGVDQNERERGRGAGTHASEWWRWVVSTEHGRKHDAVGIVADGRPYLRRDVWCLRMQIHSKRI